MTRLASLSCSLSLALIAPFPSRSVSSAAAKRMKRATAADKTEGKKRKEDEKSTKDMFGRTVEATGKWEFPHEDLMVFIPNGVQHRERVAAFDMDGTLITTKSGRVFPVDTNDWILWDDAVAPKLRQLYENEDHKLVIFTNQKGIKIQKVDKGAFKRKIEAIVRKAGVPIQVYVSLGDGSYRKPMTGMWNQFVKHGNGDVEVDVSKSVYVGDAAGRHKTKDRPRKDHSCADRLFARNVGISFATPEQFFLGDKKEEPWGPLPFCPLELKEKKMTLLEPEDTPLPSTGQELIVMVGFPGSGKSSFARKIADEHGYTVVNRDTLGTWQKCVEAARAALRAGRSVVVDNTNPDKESRRRYVVLAKEMGNIPLRCFEMTSSMHHAMHNVKYRILARGEQDISSMVLRMHASKYEKPTLSEGFSSIVHVNFVPEFSSESDRDLYFQYLVD